jgi:hypothetical protein
MSISFSSTKSKLIFSKYVLNFLSVLLLSVFATIFAVNAMRLIVRCSLPFAAFGYFSVQLHILLRENLLYFAFFD